MRLDTPKITLKTKCIWLCVIHSVILNASPANAVNINEVDKYKIYIHIKVLSSKEYLCITNLWTKENRLWDPYAKNKNSSAFGIPQLLKMKERNPYMQMDLGYKYIIHRYKSACNAWSFHVKHGYY